MREKGNEEEARSLPATWSGGDGFPSELHTKLSFTSAYKDNVLLNQTHRTAQLQKTQNHPGAAR